MNRLLNSDTIFALASGLGKSGVAVIRISGPEALTFTANQILNKPVSTRVPTIRKVCDPFTKEVIDPESLILTFPENKSFTGEPTLELQVHGGRAIIRDTINALSTLPNHRLAEPGEFSRRAFKNNRLVDLTQCEALACLIDANSSIERKLAMGNFSGNLRNKLSKWSEQVLKILAHCEADLDFGSESGGDTQIKDDLIETFVIPHLKCLNSDMFSTLKNSRNLKNKLNSGVKIAIVGHPNAGKSSLLNNLAKREASIVTEIPGTTRDVVSVEMELGGIPVVLQDTAGIREAIDSIEKIGIEKAKQTIQKSDIILHLVDVAESDFVDIEFENSIKVGTKVDLCQDYKSRFDIQISNKTGENMTALIDMISAKSSEILEKVTEKNDEIFVTEERQLQHIKRCLDSFDDFYVYLDVDRGLAVEQLRLAYNELMAITGRGYLVDSVLDTIFSTFCVGK